MREMTVMDKCREPRGNDFVVWARVLRLCDMFIVGQLTREMNWLHYLYNSFTNLKLFKLKVLNF